MINDLKTASLNNFFRFLHTSSELDGLQWSGMSMHRLRKKTKALLQLLFVIYFLLPTDSDGRYLFFPSRTQTLANAVIVGGALLPHGDFALDPTFFSNGTVERNVADDVAKGARRAGQWIAGLRYRQNLYRHQNSVRRVDYGYDLEKEPLIVLMTTPHGIKLDYDYGIYVSSKGSGTATIGLDCIGHTMKDANDGSQQCQRKPYNVTLQNIDLAPTSLVKNLLTNLKEDKRHPVSGIFSYNDEAPIPLNWGEIIPLLLLPNIERYKTASSVKSLKNSILPLIWTFPYRRYDHSVDMVPELLQVGADIMDWAQKRPEKIAIIVSGDLSHTHQSNGPYGYSPASSPYDHAIGRWAGGKSNGTAVGSRRVWDPCQPEATDALLNRAKNLQPNALSCGFTGYVMWHGMMCKSSSIATPPSPSNERDVAAYNDTEMKKDGRPPFTSKVFVNKNVTYYGMIGAIFEPHYVADHVDNSLDIDIRKEDH